MTAVVNGSTTPSVTSSLSSGSGCDEPLDQPLLEVERDDERRREREQADHEACAQLAEVLDERGLLAVLEAPRQTLQGHVAAG